MSKKVNPTAVGIFVAGALVFSILGLILLGSGRLFETRESFIVYFRSSANGLKAGSDVLLGGVKVGSVQKMFVQFDPETNEKIIPVIIELSANRLTAISANKDRGKDEILSRESIGEAIENGLRARLRSQSALTGQLYIDLDFLPDDKDGYLFPEETIDGLVQIPTVKSQIERVLEMIAKGVEGLGQRDLGELLDKVNDLLVNIDAKITDLDLKSISDNTNATLKSANEAIKKIDTAVAQVNEAVEGDRINQVVTNLDDTITQLKEVIEGFDGNALDDTIKKVGTTLDSLDAAAENIARLTDPEAPVTLQLNRPLADVKGAAASIKELADFLRRNPNALVTGKKRP